MGSKTQKIGFWAASSIAIGNVVGSGAFALPASLAKYGNISILGWFITAIGAITLALIFAGLSSRVKNGGGPYAFISQAFGKTAGFYMCYGYWMMSVISNAALAVIATGFVEILFHTHFSPEVRYAVEIMLLIAVTSLNLVGVKAAGYTDIIMTALKLIPLILLPIFAIFAKQDIVFDFTISLSGKDDFASLNAVIFATMWAFIGVESTTVPSNQIQDSCKTLPKAIVFGTLIASFVYILGSVATLNLIPRDVLLNSSTPYADLASFVFGGYWGDIIAIAGLIAVLGTLNGWTLVVGKIPEAASRDGYFPKIFSKVNAAGTPTASLIISMSATALFITATLSGNLLEQFNIIIDASVTIVLFVYIASIIAYLQIILENKELTFGKMMLCGVALSFVIYACMAIQLSWILIAIGLMFTGVLVRIAMSFNKKQELKC